MLDFSIGKKDLTLFYVATSRVRYLEDLMFEKSFNYKRLTSSVTKNASIRLND